MAEGRPMSGRPPTPQGIETLLAAAGFERSVAIGSRPVTGYTEGYDVQQNPFGPGVIARYWPQPDARDLAATRAMLARYAAALGAYQADMQRHELIVTAPKEG